jgi:hypothetical protein
MHCTAQAFALSIVSCYKDCQNQRKLERNVVQLRVEADVSNGTPYSFRCPCLDTNNPETCDIANLLQMKYPLAIECDILGGIANKFDPAQVVAYLTYIGRATTGCGSMLRLLPVCIRSSRIHSGTSLPGDHYRPAPSTVSRMFVCDHHVDGCCFKRCGAGSWAATSR